MFHLLAVIKKIDKIDIKIKISNNCNLFKSKNRVYRCFYYKKNYKCNMQSIKPYNYSFIISAKEILGSI